MKIAGMSTLQNKYQIPANPIEYSNGNVVRPDEQVLKMILTRYWN